VLSCVPLFKHNTDIGQMDGEKTLKSNIMPCMLLSGTVTLILCLSQHGRRKRGVCRGSYTPTIYVGDIDMYIPLEKPNNYLAM